MRKLSLIFLLAALLGLATLWPQGRSAPGHATDGTAEAILSLIPTLQDEALAQQLKFREVPPESVKRIERTSRRVAKPEDATDETPAAPATPTTPDRLTTRSGDVVRIGHDVHVEEGELVEGDLVVMGGDIEVDGHVEGDVVAMGGDVQLDPTARVDGDVACIGGRLTQEEGAVVGGHRFTASGFRDLARQKAKIRGEEEVERRTSHLVSAIVRLLLLLGVAWGFAALAPGRTQASLDMLKRQPAVSLGVGALVFALLIPSVVALALIVAILCITIIGIPLALAALFGYVLFLILMYVWGFAVISSWLGEWALSRRGTQAVGSAGVVATAVEPTLVRKAIIGALIFGSVGFVGRLLKTLPMLHWLGVLLVVIGFAAFAIGVTFGSGAWLRNEFTSGLIGRIWRGRRGNGSAATPAVPSTPSPAPGAAPATPPPQAPPPAPVGWPPADPGASATAPPQA